MQRKKITLMNYNVLIAIFAVLACLPRPALAVDGVCGAGTGVPPFLSSGLDPNLLLVLDNSGSMLDSAYTDTTYSGPAKTNSPANDGACVDNDFDPAKTYAGYFDPENGTNGGKACSNGRVGNRTLPVCWSTQKGFLPG